MTRELPVELIVNGEPPLGYQKEDPVINPEVIQVSGPESAVEKVAQAKVTLDIAGASQSVTVRSGVEILDESGAPVSGVTIRPQLVTVTQPISLLRGFRNVAVKVVTTGLVANGYRLTNIIVTPPTVTVSSDDPLLVNELPGFIETNPINIEGLIDDIEVNASLVLPEGIILIREPGVLVQIGVAAIESSLTMPLPIELIGLSPDLSAVVSPPVVDVIVSGPIRVLEELTPASFRAVIDVTNLEPGTYQISPVIDLIPDLVQIDSILPETVEVVISLAPTPTPATTETISQTPTPGP
jgi:YbbR domain-containing protein